MSNITTHRGEYSADLYVYADGERIGHAYRVPTGRYIALHEYGSSVLPRITKHDTEADAVSTLVNDYRNERES